MPERCRANATSEGPILFTPPEVSTLAAALVPKLKRPPGAVEWRGPCPVHNGTNDNFAMEPDTGRWFCHSRCGRGGSIIDLKMELAGVDFKTAKAEVFRLVGRPDSSNRSRLAPVRIAATYDYTDQDGRLLYQVVRMDPKDFRQRRPDGKDEWTWNLHGITPVLYRLPAVTAAEVVYIAEGEKDVESLEALGLVATCNSGGAGKWRAEYSEVLRNKSVAILPDNDPPGRSHAQAVAASLYGVADLVRIVELPGLPEKGDVSDWIGMGGTREQLEALATDAPDFRPSYTTPLPGDPAHKDATVAQLPAIRSIEDIPLISACGAREIAYVREPELPESAITTFTGDAGSGKSSVALGMAAEAARGGRRVLVLDRENPLPIIAERYGRLHVPDDGTIRYWGGWLPEEAPMPGSALVLAWVKGCNPRPLIIVDSLVAFHGGDENSAVEMRAFMQQCRTLADMGAAVAVIHHTGKADTARDYRGSSDFKAAIDQGFHLSNSSPDGHLETLRLRCFKSRFGFTGELVYRYVDGRFVRDGRIDAPIRTVTEQLAALLKANPGIAKVEFEKLAEAHGIGRNRGREFIDSGILACTVRRIKGPRNTQSHYLADAVPEGAEGLDFA